MSLPPRSTSHSEEVCDFSTLCNNSISPRRNFRKVDWEKFYNTLRDQLDTLPIPCEITNSEQMHTTLKNIDDAVQDVIDACVPWTKPSPYMKRWWNGELTELRQQLRRVQKKAYGFRSVPEHPIHEERRRLRNQY
ncbi:uncharacterized protein EV420DRAFT_1274828, partial [Desarmillaria tabescens]